MQDNWQQTVGKTLAIRVTPKAANNRLVASQTEDGRLLLRVYVTTPAQDGKANKAVIKMIAKALKCAPSCLRLIKGEKDRNKIIAIEQ